MASLEGWNSAIELHPRHFSFILMAALALSIPLRYNPAADEFAKIHPHHRRTRD